MSASLASVVSEPPSRRAFLAFSALLFAASTAITFSWCGSMAAIDGMPMPGGWRMSMAWMRMPGQSWAAAAASFLGMWAVMMVAMMLPALVPVLSRYRDAVAEGGEGRLGRLTALAASGYFFVWTGVGLGAFAPGVALAALLMRAPELSRAVPLVAGGVVVVAGALQFTTWKSRRLACCGETPGILSPDAGTAWRYGVRLGWRCVRCCANLMAILLALGVMDLRAMAVVTAAITVERLAPGGATAARGVGVAVVAAGALLLAQAAGLG